MLKNPTLERLRQLRLYGMVRALEEQERSPNLIADTDFDDRLGLLVDAEFGFRTQRLFEGRLKDARLRWSQASMEDLDLRTPRGLDRKMMQLLSTGRWVEDHLSILICGPTGVGKSYVACALAQMALRRGHRVRYYRLARLLDELLAVKSPPGMWPKSLRALSRLDVLVLDDFGLQPLTPPQARDLLEVIDDRTQTRSTVIASQLPIDKWHGAIQDPTLADAILDRLVHQAYQLSMTGESMRKVHASLPAQTEEGA